MKANICVLLGLALFAVSALAAVSAQDDNAPLRAPAPFTRQGRPLDLTGVNISGGEFGHPAPGKPNIYGKTFIYPSAAELDYFAARGVNIIRLPFRWEIIQPDLSQAPLQSEISRLAAVVAQATSRGMVVILDPHDFDRYYGRLIGSSAVPNEKFAAFWQALAAAFKSNPRVYFGLMNEPHDVSVDDWMATAQAALTAIRQAGAGNTVLVPGVGWTGAHSWLENGSTQMAQIKDPLDNYMFEAHQYLDQDSSGTHPDAVSATVGSERLKAFTAWCRSQRKRALLGEFGVAAGDSNRAALDDMLGYMEANRDVWAGFTWWSAGPWWNHYMYSVEPTKDGVDQPQFAYLAPHLHGVDAGL